MTIPTATLALVAQRAGVSLLEARRYVLGMPIDAGDRVREELRRLGVDTSFLGALATAPSSRPSRISAAAISLRDETNPKTERT